MVWSPCCPRESQESSPAPQFESIQFSLLVMCALSHVQIFVTPWTAYAKLPCPSLSPRVCSNSCPLSRQGHQTISSYAAPSPLALSLSQNQVPNKYALPIGWPKHWNFSFSISTSNEYSWLISFRINWFDLLAVQGSLKSILQHHS